jgi:hypothetical protein
MILNLPCSKTFHKCQNKLAELSVRREKISPQLFDERIKFSHRVRDNMRGIRITDTLTKFDELTFAQFISELAKQKILIPLKQQNEWEEFFNHSQIKCHNITKQISETDRKINQLVYELYELTDEEIKVIEG